MSNVPATFVLGTRNAKKQRELELLLRAQRIIIQNLADFPHVAEVIEDGTSFADNARKKAREYARQLRAWVLAEDSGLCVAALGGAPGIYSARFAGPNATDTQNNELLLQRMAGTDLNRRQAHYVCHLALACPAGETRLEVEEVCHGVIRCSPAGCNGFGYDPLFEIAECHRTFGELGPTTKSMISHRGRAMRAFVRHVTAVGGWDELRPS